MVNLAKSSKMFLTTMVLNGLILLMLAGCRGLNGDPECLSLKWNAYWWEVVEVTQLEFPWLWKSSTQQLDVLIVDLTIVNECGYKISPSWYAADAEGKIYKPTIFSDIPFEEHLFITTFHPGESARGKIAFEVPVNHLPLWIRCEYCGTAEVEIQPQH